MSQEKGRPLPKFGEWDVNNPASADGFTVIFAKARDEKKATGTAAGGATGQNFDHVSRLPDTTYQQHPPTPTLKYYYIVRREVECKAVVHFTSGIILILLQSLHVSMCPSMYLEMR
ncbi:hypothetical protein ACH5RR_014504 [Cinchona calisaya]|uniref:RIN4 pathogenic type III effector avirulence factor Avr cleavage site domain-containing protein n=1 Tax=Cinchona calisaya TaxID=153742 RepID=A0ABD3A5N6_9GENT